MAAVDDLVAAFPSDEEIISSDDEKLAGASPKHGAGRAPQKQSEDIGDYGVSSLVSAMSSFSDQLPSVSDLVSGASSMVAAAPKKRSIPKQMAQHKVPVPTDKSWNQMPGDEKLTYIWHMVKNFDDEKSNVNTISKAAENDKIEIVDSDNEEKGAEAVPPQKLFQACPVWEKTGECQAGVKCNFVHSGFGRKISGATEAVDDSVGHAIEKKNVQDGAKTDKGGYQSTARSRAKAVAKAKERMIPAILTWTPHLPLR